MKKGENIQNTALKLSAFFMMLALAWLTVSTPFAFMQQQKLAQEKMNYYTDRYAAEEIPNPYSNTTEEKTETSVNTLSEYLHDVHSFSEYKHDLPQHNRRHLTDVYVAFHGELLSPPPEI